MTHLNVVAGGHYIDATFGMGGHTTALLQGSAPSGRVLALDRDPAAIVHGNNLAATYPERLSVMHSPFSQLAQCARQQFPTVPIQGILFDLGVSSPQLDLPERGFSFRLDGPLDMRMDTSETSKSPRAMDLLNRSSEKNLADLIWRLGEERYSRRIARLIVLERAKKRLVSTRELAQLIERCIPRGSGRIHPATRTFQALRIAVNDELTELEQGIQQAMEILAPGGRLVVISFHSLEDRIVKLALRAASSRLSILTRKPLLPSLEEVRQNPRSRSAKLRSAERLVDPPISSGGSDDAP